MCVLILPRAKHPGQPRWTSPEDQIQDPRQSCRGWDSCTVVKPSELESSHPGPRPSTTSVSADPPGNIHKLQKKKGWEYVDWHKRKWSPLWLAAIGGDRFIAATFVQDPEWHLHQLLTTTELGASAAPDTLSLIHGHLAAREALVHSRQAPQAGQTSLLKLMS